MTSCIGTWSHPGAGATPLITLAKCPPYWREPSGRENSQLGHQNGGGTAITTEVITNRQEPYT